MPSLPLSLLKYLYDRMVLHEGAGIRYARIYGDYALPSTPSARLVLLLGLVAVTLLGGFVRDVRSFLLLSCRWIGLRFGVQATNVLPPLAVQALHSANVPSG